MKNVLIPANLSHEMHGALKYAISLGVKNSSRLFFYMSHDNKETVTHYIDDIYSSLGFSVTESLREIIVDAGQLDDAKIKQAVETYDIEILFIGASHEAFNTTFFGTTISELIGSLKCSVLSIPYGYNNSRLDRIGYATELSDFHHKIKDIVPFARLFNASIEACHVYPVFPQKINVAKYDVKHALSQVRNENDFEKINLHFIKTPFNNEPVRGIREFIRVYKPDLLVMCHRPRGIFDILTMEVSASEAVVKISPIPILALNCSGACNLT